MGGYHNHEIKSKHLHDDRCLSSLTVHSFSDAYGVTHVRCVEYYICICIIGWITKRSSQRGDGLEAAAARRQGTGKGHRMQKKT